MIFVLIKSADEDPCKSLFKKKILSKAANEISERTSQRLLKKV